MREPSRWRVLPGRSGMLLWVGAVLAGLAIWSVATPLSVTIYDAPLPVAMLFSLTLGAAIPLSVAYPALGALLALISATVLSATATYTVNAPWPASVTTMITLSISWFLAGWRAKWFVSVTAWALGVLAVSLTAVETKPETFVVSALVADLVVFAALTLVAAVVGILVRNWTNVRAELLAERNLTIAEIAQREAVEEKARIARELHDVVAHGMSAIQVRAASARYRLHGLPADAIAEFDELAATARSSMGDMRSILGLLRDESVGAESAPQPGLSDLGTLIERARSLGEVTENGSWSITNPHPVLGVTTYRAVQEALSNAARHAPGAPITITWADTQSAHTVRIENGAATRSTDAPRPGGQGLRGMRERVQALNGTVSTAPTPGGGFVVDISLPH